MLCISSVVTALIISLRRGQGIMKSDAETSEEKKTFWSQYLASVTLSLVMLLVGLANGWSSPYLAKLSLQSSVDGIPKATDDELSWVASLMNIGRIFGATAGAIAQDTVGRKMSLCFAGIPMMTGWVCIAIADSIQWLYLARFSCGFAMGMIWTTLSLYLAEIADPEIRGSLVLWNITVQSIGVFVGNLMGPYISMRLFAYISLVPNSMFLALFPLIPDSPYRFIMAGDLDKAEESLKWFRRKNNVKQELQELQDYVSTSKNSLLERLKDLKEPQYARSFVMMFLINVFSFFGAANVINNYMEIIITYCNVSVTPSTMVTITGFAACISGILATCLVDRFGRRFLLISSSLGMAISLTCLGLHFKLLNYHEYDPKVFTWLPCTCLLVYMVSYCAGCGSIPSALVGELFSPKLKTIVSLSFSGTAAIFSSLSTVTFIPFLNLIGASWLFWIYASGTFVSIVYYYFCLPETKGKSLQDIQKK